MKNKNKISILLCCYNYEKFVAEAIQSVLDQTYDNFELLIADDCSTDNSAEVIKKFDDPRITLIQNETNLGFMRTRNKLLKMVNCEYVAFQDADDVWLPTKLEKQMEHMLAHPECAACFTSADLIDENSEVFTNQNDCDIDLNMYKRDTATRFEIIRKFYYIGNFISHPSALIKKSVIDEIGTFNEQLIQLQDYDYWSRIAAKYDIYVFNNVLMHVRRIRETHLGLSKMHGSTVRTLYESMGIIRNLIDSLDTKTLTKSFSNELRFAPKDKLDLQSEKYFLLLNWTILGVNNKLPALQYFASHYDKEWGQILADKYSYTLQDYYSETGNPIHIYPTSMYKDYTDLQEHANKLQKIVNTQTNHINELSQRTKELNTQLNGVYNSKSWKITKPLRWVNNRKTKSN